MPRFGNWAASNHHRATEPGNVLLKPDEGNLPTQSVVVVSQISSVAKSRLGERLGSLSEARVAQILAGLRFQQVSFFQRSHDRVCPYTFIEKPMDDQDIDIVELTVWLHESSGNSEASYAEELKKQIAARGGPASPARVRAWLRKRSAKREQAARRAGEKKAAPSQGEWSRIAPCPCGSDTQQLLHGYTESGGLWKGHACTCRGWQCSECARILERRSTCCR